MEKLRYYWDRLKRKPVAYNIVLAIAALVVLAIVAHMLMQLGTRHGARRTVPDFAGMPMDVAERVARDHDLELCVNDSLYVPAYDGGVILDQLPDMGVEVKPGRTIYITINSFAQKMVVIPYVAERSLRQAKNMLEIAGLGIDRIIYRADMATNYVLDEYYDNKPIRPGSRLEAEMGSGITLYVGVEGGYGTTVTPRLEGFRLQQAKSRLWEMGLNVGAVTFDEGVNLLNQKDALVYIQSPGQERSVALGTEVNLSLTLDTTKAAKMRADADKAAKGLAAERLRREKAEADSLALIGPNDTISSSQTGGDDTYEDEGFFN